MGSVVGTFLGNALTAPFRAVFGASCKDVCSGTWDVACFIENLCVTSLVRLAMVVLLCYLTLLFAYLLCKMGIVKCVAKNACKVVWKTCAGSCHALGACCGHLWHKVRDTKRVYRGRRRQPDVEEGDSRSSYAADDAGSSSSSSSSDDDGGGHRRGGAGARGRASPTAREKRKDRLRQSLRIRSLSFKEESAARSRASGLLPQHHRHHAVLPRRAEISSSSLHAHGSAAHGRAHEHRTHGVIIR